MADMLRTVRMTASSGTYALTRGDPMSCYVWISRKQLTDAGACREGLALFERIADEQGRRTKVRIPWGPLAFCWLEADRRWFASWMFVRGIVPMPNLYGAYLSGANLSGANLSGANLYGASLSGADLYGANLYGASLSGADLSGANLYGAYLSGANLSGASLSGADLSGADLSGADLYGASLSGADLSDWERGPDGYARRKSNG